MKSDKQEILRMLSAQDAPKYTSWFTNQRWRRWGHYDVPEFTAEFLEPLEKAGLIQKTAINKSRSQYSITSAGRIAIAIEEVEEAPLQIVPPRERPFVPWDGRMQWGPESERGCHRGIASFGVAC